MKTTNWIILVVGGCWIVGLIMQSDVMPHIMLDAILPPRILELTTPAERMEIVAALRKQYAPSLLSWVGASIVFGLSFYGLWASRRINRMAKL